MTIPYITLGLKIKGIYLLNRNALVPFMEPRETLASSLHVYTPLQSTNPRQHGRVDPTLMFSIEEIQPFKKRYENRYTFLTDERYNHYSVIVQSSQVRVEV